MPAMIDRRDREAIARRVVYGCVARLLGVIKFSIIARCYCCAIGPVSCALQPEDVE